MTPEMMISETEFAAESLNFPMRQRTGYAHA